MWDSSARTYTPLVCVHWLTSPDSFPIPTGNGDRYKGILWLNKGLITEFYGVGMGLGVFEPDP